MQTINPAVYAEASLFTDGAITDAVLANVAAMRGLPLYVETPAPQPPSPVTLAERALANAEAREREAVRVYLFARRELGRLNCYRPGNWARASAWRLFKQRRRQLAAAERETVAARVALDCARIAALPSLAA